MHRPRPHDVNEMSQAGPTVDQVVVAIVTYRRPDELKRLLTALNEIEVDDSFSVEVVVVDNDPEGSAEPTVVESFDVLKFPLRYYVESTPGIAAARNRAIEASVSADLLAFIDDDEEPTPQWLKELMRVHRENQADIVAGPVLPKFYERPPDWIIKGQFFERQRHQTGTMVQVVGSGNLMLRPSLTETLGPLFDASFGRAGGSDTHFCLRAHRQGFRIRWADGAVVSEWLPHERVNARWILRRAFRGGHSIVVCERLVYGSLSALFVRVAKALGRAVQGFLPLFVGALTARPHLIFRGLGGISYGAGVFWGAVGGKYHEYRQMAVPPQRPEH